MSQVLLLFLLTLQVASSVSSDLCQIHSSLVHRRLKCSHSAHERAPHTQAQTQIMAIQVSSRLSLRKIESLDLTSCTHYTSHCEMCDEQLSLRNRDHWSMWCEVFACETQAYKVSKVSTEPASLGFKDARTRTKNKLSKSSIVRCVLLSLSSSLPLSSCKM